MKQREPRHAVSLGARLRGYGDWSDIRIANVSSRGFMGKASHPPDKGAYIEVRRGSQVIVGRVVWQEGNAFGVYCQDPIDIDALKGLEDAPRNPNPAHDRRAAQRNPNPGTMLSAEMRVERSRRFASVFDFAVMSLIVLGGAALLVNVVEEIFSAPLEAVSTALGDGRD